MGWIIAKEFELAGTHGLETWMLLGAYCWMLIMRILIEWFCWMVVEGFSLIDHVDPHEVVLFNEPVHLLKAVLNVLHPAGLSYVRAIHI